MSTTDNNKLLAEFMGFQQTNIGWYDAEEVLLRAERDNTFDNLKFHTDWNWLMQVVEKIESYNYGATLFIIEDERCHVNTQNGFEIDSVGHTKIEAVYNACVEFVKWYNTQEL
jgi:hypothetical protein